MNNQNFAKRFATTFTKGLSDREFFGIKDAVKGVKETASKTIADSAAEYALNSTEEIVGQIKEDSAPIIENTARSLNPEQLDTWQVIRNNIAPEGGFLKTIFARLLWVGAKVSSFVGALVVDKWTGRNEKDINQNNIESILAWLIGKTVGTENKPINRQRSLGIPNSWVASSAA